MLITIVLLNRMNKKEVPVLKEAEIWILGPELRLLKVILQVGLEFSLIR